MGFLVVEEYENAAQARVEAFCSPDGVLRRYLQAEVTLPLLTNPPEHRLACHETVEETAYVSAHISSRIHALYSQLAAHAAATDLSTSVAPEGIELDIDIAAQSFDIYPWCDHRRYHSRRLHLQDPETLPYVPFVNKLSIQSRSTYGGVGNSYGIRPLSLLAPLQCITALPNATTLVLPWMWERPMPDTSPMRPVREHWSRPWEGPIRDARHEFGNAICEQEKFLGGRRIPASLKNALLHFWTPEQIAVDDQSVARPNLIHPAVGDPVSVGLRRLAAQLERLDLRALVTDALFPAPEEDQKQWSFMQRLRIEFHPLRPDGMWYFVGPRGEDPLRSSGGCVEEREGGFQISETADYPREYDLPVDKEIDYEYDDFENPVDLEFEDLPDMFRTEPHRERIEPLLASFAAAVANMPKLMDAEIFAYLWWAPSQGREEEYAGDAPYDRNSVYRWGVRYFAGRGDGCAGNATTTTPVVQWQVGDWRPSIKVMSLFEALGTQEWLDFEVTEGRSSSPQERLF
ncbi:hypothetical protein E8E14_004065 [Neopestalotiopsis sp. 37M]|nr:hypothetical protein E8E14_004065 [Neopestalotiopsis sp. 37M]